MFDTEMISMKSIFRSRRKTQLDSAVGELELLGRHWRPFKIITASSGSLSGSYAYAVLG